MRKRSTVGAIATASVLALGVSNLALAEVLVDEHQAIIAGWDEDGVPFAKNKLGEPFGTNTEECEGLPVAANEILFIFDQTGDDADPTVPNPGGTSANLLDVDLNDGEIFLEDLDAAVVDADSVDWRVTVDPPGEELELVSANSDVDGGQLVVAAICFAPRDFPDTATLGQPETAAPSGQPWLVLMALALLGGSLAFARRRQGEAP